MLSSSNQNSCGEVGQIHQVAWICAIPLELIAFCSGVEARSSYPPPSPPPPLSIVLRGYQLVLHRHLLQTAAQLVGVH